MSNYIADEGFVYAAAGRRYVFEAIASAKSLRAVTPGAVIALYADMDAEQVSVLAGSADLFDAVLPIPNPAFGFLDKLVAFLNPCFKRCIYLDTDIYFCRAMPELFTLLERFDMAAVRSDWAEEKTDSPLCFDDFNSGVIAYRDNPVTRRVFINWNKIFRQHLALGNKDANDQPALREAIYAEPELHFYVLPRRYNLRTVGPMLLRIGGQPVLLHGRGYDFKRLKEELSKPTPYRLVLLSGAQLSMLHFIGGSSMLRWIFIPWVKIMQWALVLIYRIKAIVRT